MPPSSTPTGYFNQTYALEFKVEGDLDGATVSPTVDNSPPSGLNAQDPQNLYRRTVPALGLVDPDYLPAPEEDDRRGTRGNRFVSFIWIEGASAGSALASVDIVDAIEGTVVQKNLGTFVGETKFFREAIFVPQGSMIRVRGLSGSSGSPIKVRLHVQFLENARDLAAAFEAQSAVESAIASGQTFLIPSSSIVTSDTTAGPRELVRYDASAGPFTISAPPTPTHGDFWAIKNMLNAADAVTISGNGNDIESTTGFAPSFSLAAALAQRIYVFDGTQWVEVAD